MEKISKVNVKKLKYNLLMENHHYIRIKFSAINFRKENTWH